MNSRQVTLIAILGIIFGFALRYWHQQKVFENTDRLYPFFNEDFWIFLIVSLVGSLIVVAVASNYKSVFELFQTRTTAEPSADSSTSSNWVIFYTGVALSFILAPALQFALLYNVVSGEGGPASAGTQVIVLSLFGWIPGAMIGGAISNSARKGTFYLVSGLAIFPTMIAWTIGINNAF